MVMSGRWRLPDSEWFDVAAYGMQPPPRATREQAGAIFALGASLRAMSPVATR